MADKHRKNQENNKPEAEPEIAERGATDRAEYEASLLLAAIVEPSEDAIVCISLDGLILSWNPGAQRILGYTSGEAIGRNIAFLIPPERVDEEARILERLRRGDRIGHYESVRLRKDGVPLDVSLTLFPIQDRAGNVIGASRVARDITPQKKAALALLEETRYLQAAKEEAERANRAKDEFLAIVSHELRTPLTAMLGWARLLASGNLDAAKAAHGIRVIERNARLQKQLIEDLLDVSRAITGKLSLAIGPVDIAKSVATAIETIRPAAEAKQIRIETTNESSLGVILGDSGRLQQVFWNLLSNAVKFTPKGGSIEVRIVQQDSMLRVSVKDSGMGIHPDFLPQLFERFRQQDSSTTRAHGGLGLGLAIVRHLVELHGGTVAAESAGPGKGARFSVELPIHAVIPPSGPAARATAAEAGALAGAKVLVLEDEDDSRELILAVLEAAGADGIGAATVDGALEEIERSRPTVVVSDIGMPGKDGYQFIRELRARGDGGGNLPVLALTAYARDEDQMKAIEAGFDMHVAKPIEPAELTRRVAQLAGKEPRTQ